MKLWFYGFSLIPPPVLLTYVYLLDLLPRYMQVFSSNAFFKGMMIPKPDRTEPLEEKLPTASHLAMGFLHVRLRSYILPPR